MSFITRFFFHRKEIETVCIFLGPYRNLTTLTASILGLHPQCQVLNHGWGTILIRPDLNFFREYSEEKFKAFCVYVAKRSRRRKRDSFGGGHIVYSHAFIEHPEMAETYAKRYGSRVFRNDIRCLVWKESQRTTNILMRDPKGMEEMIRRNPKLRFIMPVRHPIDCAVSNIHTGIMVQSETTLERTTEMVLEEIFSDYQWFLEWQRKFPQSFLWFTEKTFNREVSSQIQDFLKLDHDNRWQEDALRVFQITKKYNHSSALYSLAQQLASKYVSAHEPFYTEIKRFFEESK